MCAYIFNYLNYEILKKSFCIYALNINVCQYTINYCDLYRYSSKFHLLHFYWKMTYACIDLWNEVYFIYIGDKITL
jgi:hypothetical protein